MHSHHHHKNEPHKHDLGENASRAFAIGMVLNIAFVAVELFYGYYSHALSLVADAWHNLGDVAGLGISLFALKMAGAKPSFKYTYGYSKGTILASFLNSVILLLAIGSIGYEAFHRFRYPVAPQWETISWVATLGIFINTATAFLFMHKQELNSKAAFLHMVADAGVSLGVVLGGFLIHWTNYLWIDPAISILICLVIIWGTWGVFKNSLRLSLDGVPENVEMEKIKSAAMEMPFVKDIHHLHIWAMSTSKNALTAHLTLTQQISETESAKLREDLKHKFLHLNIQHATLELELHHTPDCEAC